MHNNTIDHILSKFIPLYPVTWDRHSFLLRHKGMEWIDIETPNNTRTCLEHEQTCAEHAYTVQVRTCQHVDMPRICQQHADLPRTCQTCLHGQNMPNCFLHRENVLYNIHVLVTIFSMTLLGVVMFCSRQALPYRGTNHHQIYRYSQSTCMGEVKVKKHCQLLIKSNDSSPTN